MATKKTTEKTKRKRVSISGSIFAIVRNCPGSLLYTVGEDPYARKSKGAAAGTARHAEIEADLKAVVKYLPPGIDIEDAVETGDLKTEVQVSGSFGGLSLSGTIDCLATVRLTHVHVIDWKTGFADVTEMDPAQLEFYAYLLLQSQPKIEQFTLRYVNPDLDVSNAWVYTAAEIREMVERDLAMIEKRLREKGEHPLTVGQHCRYCKAAARCKPLKRALLNFAEPKYRDLKTEDWSDSEIGLLIVADKLIDKIKADIKARLESRVMVSGYEVVRLPGSRSFALGVDDRTVSARLGVPPENVSKTVLRSPADLEKDYDIRGLSDLIVQPARKILKTRKTNEFEKGKK